MDVHPADRVAAPARDPPRLHPGPHAQAFLRVRAGDLEGAGRNDPGAAEGRAGSLSDAHRDRLKSRARRTAMRTCKTFVLGAVVGAAVVWLWGRALEEYVAEKTRGVRTKAAEGVRAVEEKAGEVL